MNSAQLFSILNSIISPEKCHSLGVFPRDKIPIPDKFPSCYIANTDDSHKSGSHWVAFYFLTPNAYEFFDSYGLHPQLYGFKSFSIPITHYNTVSVQPFNSDGCGQFCLYFLCQRSKGFHFSYIIHSFSIIDLKWNNSFVKKFVQQFHNPKQFSFIKNPDSSTQKSLPFSYFKKKLQEH